MTGMSPIDDRITDLDIPLDFPYSNVEWNAIFDALAELLDHELFWVRYQATSRIARALEVEMSQRSCDSAYQPTPLFDRLFKLLLKVQQQTLNKFDVFDLCCAQLSYSLRTANRRKTMRRCLDKLAAQLTLTIAQRDAILAAQIFYGRYDSNWQTVGQQLIKWLGHHNLTVRACASEQISKFCSAFVSLTQYQQALSENGLQAWQESMKFQGISDNPQRFVGMPSVDDLIQMIHDREIDRPGIAGAFVQYMPKATVDFDAWLLGILARSPHPDPDVPYFLNLGFIAHEHFSRNPSAVWQLMAMGRHDIAVMAATEENMLVDGMEAVLQELAQHPDIEIRTMAANRLNNLQ